MGRVVRGRVWKLGDHVASENIVPMEVVRLHPMDPAQLARHCLTPLDPDFPKKAARGDILVAGRNFGCGHGLHWEGPLSIKGLGIPVVLCDSVARDFFRTAITFGLPILTCAGISHRVDEGETLEVDLDSAEVRRLSMGETVRGDPLPALLKRILDAGGLLGYLRGLQGSVRSEGGLGHSRDEVS